MSELAWVRAQKNAKPVLAKHVRVLQRAKLLFDEQSKRADASVLPEDARAYAALIVEWREWLAAHKGETVDLEKDLRAVMPASVTTADVERSIKALLSNLSSSSSTAGAGGASTSAGRGGEGKEAARGDEGKEARATRATRSPSKPVDEPAKRRPARAAITEEARRAAAEAKAEAARPARQIEVDPFDGRSDEEDRVRFWENSMRRAKLGKSELEAEASEDAAAQGGGGILDAPPMDGDGGGGILDAPPMDGDSGGGILDAPPMDGAAVEVAEEKEAEADPIAVEVKDVQPLLRSWAILSEDNAEYRDDPRWDTYYRLVSREQDAIEREDLAAGGVSVGATPAVGAAFRCEAAYRRANKKIEALARAEPTKVFRTRAGGCLEMDTLVDKIESDLAQWSSSLGAPVASYPLDPVSLAPIPPRTLLHLWTRFQKTKTALQLESYPALAVLAKHETMLSELYRFVLTVTRLEEAYAESGVLGDERRDVHTYWAASLRRDLQVERALDVLYDRFIASDAEALKLRVPLFRGAGEAKRELEGASGEVRQFLARQRCAPLRTGGVYQRFLMEWLARNRLALSQGSAEVQPDGVVVTGLRWVAVAPDIETAIQMRIDTIARTRDLELEMQAVSDDMTPRIEAANLIASAVKRGNAKKRLDEELQARQAPILAKLAEVNRVRGILQKQWIFLQKRQPLPMHSTDEMLALFVRWMRKPERAAQYKEMIAAISSVEQEAERAKLKLPGVRGASTKYDYPPKLLNFYLSLQPLHFASNEWSRVIDVVGQDNPENKEILFILGLPELRKLADEAVVLVPVCVRDDLLVTTDTRTPDQIQQCKAAARKARAAIR